MKLEDIYSELKQYTDFSILEKSLDLYESHRIEGATSYTEDMLLFQWGIYDWGHGEFFELDTSRQISPSETDELTQLRCTLYFKPTSVLRQIKAGNKWCNSPNEIKAFKEYVLNSQAFTTCSNITPLKSNIEQQLV